jgi:hypothetical protein
VAHIPDALADLAEEWLFDRFFSTRFGSSLPKRAVLFRIAILEDIAWRFRRHQQLLRILCCSVHPHICVRCEGERRALIDVLEVPTCLRDSFVPVNLPQRRRVSESIGLSAQLKSIRDRLAPLSAFADGAWPFLRTHWEIAEHQDRVRERRERADALARIRVEWPEGIDERHDHVREAATRRLLASWPEDARQRHRSWIGWW